ncbi:hypothetical protein V5O48_013163 [Marasmius crinis-equi]|uniref:Uncharacterized protein n=1 Tax=Marasmius crinis-equi TaxID=585013 RepID=A0ABR3F0V0_9AGAR
MQRAPAPYLCIRSIGVGVLSAGYGVSLRLRIERPKRAEDHGQVKEGEVIGLATVGLTTETQDSTRCDRPKTLKKLPSSCYLTTSNVTHPQDIPPLTIPPSFSVTSAIAKGGAGTHSCCFTEFGVRGFAFQAFFPSAFA